MKREADEKPHEAAVRRQRAAELQAKQDRISLWAGGAGGVVGLVAAITGLYWHDHWVMIGGFLAFAVATKIVPFSEVRKLIRRNNNSGD